MQRGKRAAYSTLSGILSQVVSIVCGFILPRLILSRFGSSYNGIISSVSQFMSVIALLRAGIAGASHAALYKSLAKKDTVQISATVRATEKFMRKIALIFAAFIVVFSCVYPLMVQDEFDWLFSATLVLIVSISTFVQYYFGFTYQILLQADQRRYILSMLDIISIILNTALAAVMVWLGFGIHAVKLGSAVAFSITPIFLNIYCRRHYKLQRDVQPDYSLISQRWDAFFHQLAAFVHDNTDVTLLTIFSNTKEVSVYTVYYLVGHGLRRAVSTISSGIDAAFGNMLANNEMDNLRRNLNLYELLTHYASSILYGVGFVLITPFVRVYTSGITDVNYSRHLFGYLVIVSELLYSLHLPYRSLVHASGQFKQTKLYNFIEAALNLGISLCLVHRYGIVGLVAGTTISTAYLGIAYALYSSRRIAMRSVGLFIKRYAVTAVNMAIIALMSILAPTGSINSYFSWVIYAVGITAAAVIVTTALNMVFYRESMGALVRKLKGIAGSMIHRK